MPALHLVRGIPGSGKSTFARRAFPGVLLLENDMFHMHAGKYDWHAKAMPSAIRWCMDMTRSALECGMDVVVANTFTKQRFVDAYKRLAEELGAEFKVYRCIGSFQNVHGLDDAKVQSFKSAMEDWPGEAIVNPGLE